METVLSGNQWSITKRPQKLDEVFGQDKIVKQFKNILESKKAVPNVLWFEGRYGCGKTTIAKIIAKTIQCKNKDEHGNPCNQCPSCKSIENETFGRNTIMFNAGANGLVDPVRELIGKTEFPPMMDGNWVIMIEEAQKLVDGAVQALLKTVEVPRSNVYFIFTSMEEDQNVFEMKSMKNFKALKSRCRVFKVQSASVTELGLYMRNILRSLLKENPSLGEKLPDNFDDIMVSIANHCNGSYRTAIQTFEEVIDAEAFTPEDLNEMFGIVDDKNVYNALFDILDGKGTEVVKSTFMSGSNDSRKTNFTDAFNKVSSAKILKTFSQDFDNPYAAQSAKLASHPNLEVLYKGLSDILDYCSKNYFDYYYCGAKICDLIENCKLNGGSLSHLVEARTPIAQPQSEARVPTPPQTETQPRLQRMTTDTVIVNQDAPAQVVDTPKPVENARPVAPTRSVSAPVRQASTPAPTNTAVPARQAGVRQCGQVTTPSAVTQPGTRNL